MGPSGPGLVSHRTNSNTVFPQRKFIHYYNYKRIQGQQSNQKKLWGTCQTFGYEFTRVMIAFVDCCNGYIGILSLSVSEEEEEDRCGVGAGGHFDIKLTLTPPIVLYPYSISIIIGKC